MKVAILNDTHAGIRNSSDIFADNADRFYSDVFFPFLRKNNIKRIIHLGDVFDNRKFINFKSLHRFRKGFLAKLREYGMHMDVIPGNHDTFYKNTNELNALKELLGHYMGEVTIHMDPTVLDFDGTKIGLVPWICPDNEERCMHFIKTVNCDMLGGHFEIAGFDMLRGVKNEHGLSPSVFDRFDMVLSGHFHVRSQQGNITYLGSQMEFFWSDAHDNKYFHIYDTERKDLEAQHNPHTLFEKIYYDDNKEDYLHYNLDHIDGKFVKVIVVNKSDSFTFDRFIDRIQNRKIHELKIAENFNEFLGDNVNDDEVSVEDTTVLLDSYIDAVETDLDKDRIKKQMHELMIEAQALEIA